MTIQPGGKTVQLSLRDWLGIGTIAMMLVLAALKVEGRLATVETSVKEQTRRINHIEGLAEGRDKRHREAEE